MDERHNGSSEQPPAELRCLDNMERIDPAPFLDASGKWWISFGSFEDGIHIIQLDPSTGRPLSSNPTPYPIIASRIGGEEGSFMYPSVVNGTQ